MGALELFNNQQLGNCKWRKYDEILKRFRCLKAEHYNQILPVSGMEASFETPIFACKFSSQFGNENILALANEEGRLAVHNVDSAERSVIQAHDNAIFDLTWLFGNMTIATASGDHTTRLFNVTPTDIRPVRVFFGHSRSVKTVASRQDDPAVFATGGRDGKIILWDTRGDHLSINGKADKTIPNSHSLYGAKGKKRAWGLKSITGLVFKDDYNLVSCGAGDGYIKIWDLRKNYLAHKKEPLPKYKIPYSGNTSKNGFSHIMLDESRIRLYANCLDNNIYCYNLNTFDEQPIMTYKGYENNTFYVKAALSNDGSYLMSGSSDDNAYIWALNDSQPLVKLVGHTAEVTCVAWCHTRHLLVTCSDDMTHKIWKIGTEERPDNWEVIGKGEAVPIKKTARKRPENTPVLENKKLARTCDKCGNLNDTTKTVCTKCSGVKRKLDENSPVIVSKRCLFSSQNGKLESVLEEELNDLPNFVMDGTAPHLVCSPPQKKGQDWLTRLRIERKIRRDMEDLTNNPSKIPKLDLNRVSSPKSHKSSPKQVHSPILRFCKITSVCSSNKSNGSNGLVSSPRSTQ